MRQRLRRIHPAPQALAIGLQLRHPLLHFFHPRRFKEIFHAEDLSPVNCCHETTACPVIIVSFWWSSSVAVPLRGRSNPRHQTVPALLDLSIVRNLPHRPVREPESRNPVLFDEPVLHIRDGGIRHKQRSVNFQQCGRLNRLYVAPEVSRIVSEIAIPAASRPRLKLHWHGPGPRGLVLWSHLFEYGLEHHVD